jgi:hypothetical protein
MVYRTRCTFARAMDPLMSEPRCCYKDSNLLVGHQPLRFYQVLRYIHYGTLIPWVPVRGNGGENNMLIPLFHGICTLSSAICLFFATVE